MDPDLLVEKLPVILDWIDDLLARHRDSAQPVAELGFRRLPLFYDTQLLETTGAVIVDHVPAPPLTALGIPGFEEFENLAAAGITYRDTFFVSSSHAADEALHFHELVHVLQWRQLGEQSFLLAYASGYVAAGGYRENPLEQIAYDLEAQFRRGSHHFPVAPLVKQHLENIRDALPASFRSQAVGRGGPTRD